jgi:hypothetical protein
LSEENKGCKADFKDLQKSTTTFSHRIVAFSSLFILTPKKQNKKNRKIARSYNTIKWIGSIAEWLERLTANSEVATVLGSIPASSDTVESEGRQMKQC